MDASNDHQGAAAAAIQLFTLGIPCIYYGMEQGLASGAEQVNGCTCVSVEDWLLGPSEVLILANGSGAAERLKRRGDKSEVR